MKAEQGMVRTQAMTMRWPQIQRTARMRLRGADAEDGAGDGVGGGDGDAALKVEPMMVVAAAVSAQKPPTG